MYMVVVFAIVPQLTGGLVINKMGKKPIQPYFTEFSIWYGNYVQQSKYQLMFLDFPENPFIKSFHRY